MDIAPPCGQCSGRRDARGNLRLLSPGAVAELWGVRRLRVPMKLFDRLFRKETQIPSNKAAVLIFAIAGLFTASLALTVSLAATADQAATQESASTPNVPAAAPAFVPQWQARGVNVTKHGVVGDGLTDNLSALQALIDSQPNGTLFYFPAGTYLVSNTINFVQNDFAINGDADREGAPASILKCDTPDVVMAKAFYEPGVGSLHIRNMQFIASNQGGTGLYTGNVASAVIEHCIFKGHVGTYMHYPFVTAFRSVRFQGDGPAKGSHIGLFLAGVTECMADGCEFTGWDEGARISGAGMSMIRSIFKRNKIGLNMGIDEHDRGWITRASSLTQLTFTDNDLAFNAVVLAGVAVSDIKIHGTANAPSGQSSVGFVTTGIQQCTFSQMQIDGTYSDTAARVNADGKNSSFLKNTVSNSNPSGKVWDIAKEIPASVKFETALLPGQVPIVDKVIGWSIPANSDVVDVTEHGVVGDASTDNAKALQALIDASKNAAIFYFPRGIYKVRATLDFSRLTNFGLIGDLKAIGGENRCSMIFGEFSGPLIKANYSATGGAFHIRDIYLRSWDTVVHSTNPVGATVENAEIIGTVGILLNNPVNVSLRSLNFDPNVDIRHVPLTGNANLGIVLNGGHDNNLEEVNVMGYLEGVRATGDRLFMYASRFEVDHVGLNLGILPDGTAGTLTNSTFSGITFEANDTGINLANCKNCFLSTISGQGSSNAPTGMSQIGINVLECNNVTFSAVEFGGDFTNVAGFVSGAASNILFSDCGINLSIKNKTTIVR